ncbi:OmpW/AlkL family protein [Paracoccus seriniphilus]|uniref:Outer membrane protein n=1 Tax=Paracoccus seriniphilus TaxID=184748 RepID=A0A239PW07_9RHOB|nr:OmpW family outer membrane protein [Paracoccus seriniphilus]WCR13190.1 OmpW family protein [Paracoccus seriniphilus]SNT74484.1 outer membrane protein [Paracoccus seriniphilus]
MRHLLIAATLTACGLGLTTPALAQSQGDWTLGLGIANVNPKSDNGTLAEGTVPVEIDDSTRPTVTAEYFIRDNLGVEVLAALPFKHTITSNGSDIGTVKQLPPVVSLQYHFDATPKFKPFVGVGVNFTGFYDADTTGALAGSELRVKNSWGLAAHLGADYWVSDRSAIRADLRWIDIDADVELNGSKIGEVEVDPVVAGISYVMKF